MKKIGVLFGMENTFPGALVDRINSMEIEGIRAEFVHVGGVRMADPSGYDGHRRPHLARDALLSRLAQKCGAHRHAGHQQSLLVVCRRQVLQLRPRLKARRRRPPNRSAAAQAISAADQHPLRPQSRISRSTGTASSSTSAFPPSSSPTTAAAGATSSTFTIATSSSLPTTRPATSA